MITMKSLQRIFSPLFAFIFMLGSLVPLYPAFAFSDCGEHELVSCKTHNDEHLIAIHSLEKSGVNASGFHHHKHTQEESSISVEHDGTREDQHDDSHQFEKGRSFYQSVSILSFDTLKELYVATFWIEFKFQGQKVQLTDKPYFLLITDSVLGILSSIRLLV